MKVVSLYGDSIFDNKNYVIEDNSVRDMLIMKLNAEDEVTLLAEDGATSNDLAEQTRFGDLDSTHFFFSIGGNDALKLRSNVLLNNPVDGSDVLIIEDIFSTIENFRKNLIENLHDFECISEAVTLCTIYTAIPGLTKQEIMAINIFNSVIIEVAATYGFGILDLRRVCTKQEDFSSSSPIEPSEIGGLKIATAISDIVYNNESTFNISKFYYVKRNAYGGWDE